MREINTLTATELGTLWWSVRWVRGLVLMLIPIGIVDTVYTLSMVSLYGIEVEFNPITRFFIGSGMWYGWALMNILGFTLFCMIAGSYYLHTRNHPAGPDTFWLSTVIALRIAMAAYNVTFYYLPVVETVFPPLWAGMLTFVGSLYFLNKVFRRERDLTWRSATGFVTSRIDDRTDAKLIRAAMAGKPRAEEQSQPVQPIVEDPEESKDMTSIWIKRGAYLAASALSFVAMAVALQIIAIIADFQRWQFEYFVLNQYTGPIVMGSFVVILVFIGISMFFLFKAFTTVQADELPI